MKNLQPIIPNKKQMRNAISFGWQYLGDGLFCKGQMMGWYSADGFIKE